MELKIKQPSEKTLPLLRRQLGALVHRVGGGVAVGNDDAAILVKTAPVLFVAGIAVHRIKAGGCIGVYIVRVLAELPCQIHFYKGTGVALIIREGDLPHRKALLL